MPSKRKVLLYNPKTVFFDMPLALLAIGSNLDPARFEVIIVDGRLSKDPLAEISAHLSEAICFAVTVITGAPIKDALLVSEQVKQMSAELPIIWGGWHTSLFPTKPLEDHGFIDITVQGQGEITFKELVEAMDQGGSLAGINGISYRSNSELVKNPARVITPMDDLPAVNYRLINVPDYYAAKNKKQFDFISSTGCYFRCAFCADPFVFQRKFTAIEGTELGQRLATLEEEYGFDDLNFQDETFFTYANRIEAFADELMARNTKFSWAATMRADQGVRMSKELWEKCRESGLRRLLIGVESGSQEMMDWLKKDIKLEHVFECADRCKELGIAVIFPFIVGFPNETDESVAASVSVIKQLRRMSRNFETPVFYFKPYPGSAITSEVVNSGFELPSTTREWADFDYIGSSGPWVSPEKERFIERFKFYANLGYGKERGIIARPLQELSRMRCESEQFGFPIEKAIIEFIRPKAKLS